MLFVLQSRMAINKLSLFAAACLIAAVALTSAACKSGYPVSARNSQESKEPRAVKVTRVAEMPMEQAVTVTGTLAAQDQATVSAKVPGRIKNIMVDLGSVVGNGD